MVKVNIHELKAQLSHFLKLIQNGEVVVVYKRNLPIVDMTQHAIKKKRPMGLASKHYPNFEWDFSALEEPMSEEEIKLWEDGPIFPPEK